MKRIFQGLVAGILFCSTTALQAQSVEQRLQELEDQRAITQLVVVDYANALDLMDMAAFADLFAPDGVFSLGGMERKGPDQIRTMFAATSPNTVPPTMPPLPQGVLPMPPMETPMRPRMVPHVITNPSYRISGNSAEGRSYWMEIMLIEGRPGIVNMGHYDDQLKKVGGKWKFARRTVIRDVPIGTSVVPLKDKP